MKMDVDFLKYRISRSRELIRDLEERLHSNYSALKYQYDGKRIQMLTEYKDKLIIELNKHEKDPKNYVIQSVVQNSYSSKVNIQKTVKKQEPIISKDVKPEELNPYDGLKEKEKK